MVLRYLSMAAHYGLAITMLTVLSAIVLVRIERVPTTTASPERGGFVGHPQPYYVGRFHPAS